MKKNTPDRKELTNIWRKRVLIGLAIIFIISLMIGFIVDSTRNNKIKNAGWEIISSSYYTCDNERCIGYRVYLPADLWSNDDIRTVYRFVTDDDYYMHTVWFYRSKNAADGTHSADATMEELRPGLTPEIQR